VDRGHWEVAEDEPHGIADLPQDRVDDGMRCAAKRTLIVAILK